MGPSFPPPLARAQAKENLEQPGEARRLIDIHAEQLAHVAHLLRIDCPVLLSLDGQSEIAPVSCDAILDMLNLLRTSEHGPSLNELIQRLEIYMEALQASNDVGSYTNTGEVIRNIELTLNSFKVDQWLPERSAWEKRSLVLQSPRFADSDEEGQDFNDAEIAENAQDRPLLPEFEETTKRSLRRDG